MQHKVKLAAIVLTSLLAANSEGAINNYGIGLNFATEEPNGGNLGALQATDVSGYFSVAQANWNNLTGASGSSDTLVANSNGTSVATSVHLDWASANTWSSEGRGENNGVPFLPGTADHTNMIGYLDTGNATTTIVTLTGIPTELRSQGYDVYVYAIGGATAVGPPRGGSYRIVDPATTNVVRPYQLVATAVNATNYVLDLGIMHTNNEFGNYLVFRGLTNADIRIEATTAVNPLNGTPRAPVNAVQLVAARSPGEAPSASAPTVATNAGSGKVVLSWTPGAGSSGSLVIGRIGAPVTAEPVDGVTYTGNESFGLGSNLVNDWIGANNYVVFSGSGSSVTVSNVPGGSLVNFAVYSYTGSGANINYTLASPAVTNAAAPATLLSIALQLPTTRQTNFISQATVLANFDAGAPVNVTANANTTYISGNTNLATVTAGGLVTGVGAILGTNVTITAVYQGRSNSVTINLVAPPPTSIMHRYSFNGNANDSVGGKNGNLNPGATIAGGEVSFDGVSGYVDIPGVVLTNLDAMSWEVWVTDNGSIRWSRIFDFGSQTVNADSSTTGLKYMFLTIPNGNVGAGLGAVRTAYQIQGGGEQLLNWGGGAGARPPVGKKTHLVVTTDPETRRCVLYADGVQVAINTGFLPTHTPKAIGTITNNWLGRSQYSGDAYFTGSIDEFRIYSNALTSVQVAANAAAGPGSPVADPGALQSISLLANTSMNQGVLQNAVVSATYANVSGVNVTGAGPGPIYSSDNPNFVTVNAAGLITAVAPGTANIQASFGGKTDSKAITVAAPSLPVLTHRYSFTANANDSVGTAHGTALQGAPTFSGGVVTLDGTASIALPSGIINGYESLTVEAWAYGPSFVSGGPMYLFAFGNTNGAAAAVNFARLAVHSGGTTPSMQASVNGAVLNNGVLVGNATQTTGWGSLPGPTNHIVVTFDSAQRLTRLYMDGVLVQSAAMTLPLSGVSNLFSYIGKSLAPAEAVLFAGYLDEFRIYNGALDLGWVRASRVAGPNNPVTTPVTYTSVSLSVPSAVIQGTRPQPTVRGSSASLANVDLTQVATLTSSDPNVISILTNGRIQANIPGTATITATMGSVSDSKVVQVAPKQVALMHRYSFNTDFNDSVRGANGIPRGNAALDGAGGLTLDGTRGTFVDLPKYLIDGYQTLTVEAWFSPVFNANNTRLFDFGSYDTAAGPSGVTWVEMAPRTGGDTARIEIATSNNNNQGATLTPSINDRGPLHVVCVYQTDATQTRFANFYTNGVLAASITNGNNTFIRALSALDNQWSFIGRSQWSGDTYLNATIDEFRVYHGALSSAQVAADFAAGPNGNPAVGILSVPPFLSFALSGNNIVLSWSDAAAALVAAGAAEAAANTYTNVPGATSPYTLSPTGAQLFFRLKK